MHPCVDEETILKAKAAIRIEIARTMNTMLERWSSLPEPELHLQQQAMLMVLADVTADLATGILEPSREHFLAFLGRAYDLSLEQRYTLSSPVSGPAN